MHHGTEQENIPDNFDKILLVGNANVGKSVIFGYLTGRYVTVSNYPGTTVEVSRGKATVNGRSCSVIDTPGVNSLLPMSEDEEVTRNILLNERHERVVHVSDAKNLNRSLLISLQLAEMGLPFIKVLNLYDEVESRGITIDSEKLSEIMGVAVIPAVATRRQGMDVLAREIDSPRLSKLKVRYDKAIEKGIEEIEPLLPESNISGRAISLMLLSGDSTLTEWLHDHLSQVALLKVEDIVHRVQASSSESISFIINRRRLRTIEKIMKQVYITSEQERGGFSLRLGNAMMHPLWGIPILFVILYLVYLFVGDFGAGTSVDFLETEIFGRYIAPWSTKLADRFIPIQFLRDFLVGEYGLITMALSYAVAIVLPIVGTFFIAFGILEDSGYLPRLAVMVNKIFRLMGLNGKAVLPMVLGLGCDTMATLTTRILDTRKDRIIVTLLLALGVPCSAQLGVILGMLGGVSFSALLVWLGVIMVVLLLVGYLTSRLIEGDNSDFIYELPPIRLPQMKNILMKTVARVDWYMKEAVPLFVLGTLVLFILDKLNLLKLVERIFSPIIVGLLDLPPKAAEAFLIGFLRRDYGAAGLFALQKDGQLDSIQVVVSLVTMTLFIPCIANLFMIIKERGMKVAAWMLAFILPFALLVGGGVNAILRMLGVSF